MNLRHDLPLLFTIVLMSSILTGCGDDGQPAPGAYVMDDAEHERWEIALVEMRIEKNETFADPATSPLPADRIAGFEGLNYYFPEPGLRFRTPLLAEAGTDTVHLTKRGGEIVPYLRRGKVAFTWQDHAYTLAVFGPADPEVEAYLWLPFFDETNGTETLWRRPVSRPHRRRRGSGRPRFQLRLQPAVRLQPRALQLHLAAGGEPLALCSQRR